MAKKKSGKKKKAAVRYVEVAPQKAGLLDGLKQLLPESASGQLLVGVLVGGAITYMLSDDKVRETIIRQGVLAFTSIAGALAEVKEQVADIQAEVMAKEA